MSEMIETASPYPAAFKVLPAVVIKIGTAAMWIPVDLMSV
jgi:hypothetical protein